MPETICLSCFQKISGVDKVFSCTKNHHFCAPCGKAMHLECECYLSLQLLTLENADPVSTAGLECLGNLLNLWQCNWSGIKSEFHEHFIRSHNHIETFTQFQVSSVPFRRDQLLSAMTTVRAFDCTFIFYYHTNPSTKMIYFLIFLLDNDDQPKPESFLYELMIKSPNEHHCKIKFVEKCYVFDDDVMRLRDKELCAAVTHQTIEKYLQDDHICFSFLIKRNCKESLVVVSLPDEKKVETLKKKAVKPHSVPNKGSLRGNSVRKGLSIPDVKATGGGVLKKEVVLVEVEEVIVVKGQPPDYSSINRININSSTSSPAYCLEALKRNDNELQQLSARSVDDCYHIPNAMCQAYKNPDNKIFRQKYPTSCLSKPILKR